MQFKVLAAFFVTLLAVHASTQTPLEGAKNVAATILEDILEVTGAVLEEVHNIVSDLRANEESIRAKIVSIAVKVADRVNHEVVSLVDNLKDGATDDGKAVLSCIEAEETKTDAAIEVFANDVGACIGNEVELVFDEVDVVLGQLDDLQADVQGQADKLRDCTSSDVSCLLEFAQSAAATVQKIGPIVKGDIEAVVELVKTILRNVDACQLRQELRSSIQEIFNDAVVCIRN